MRLPVVLLVRVMPPALVRVTVLPEVKFMIPPVAPVVVALVQALLVPNVRVSEPVQAK